MSVNNEQSYDAVASDFASSRSTAEIPPKVQELAELLRAQSEILDIGSGSGRPIDNFCQMPVIAFLELMFLKS